MNSLSVYDFDITITPELCGIEPKLLPTGVFTVFQAAATRHAELIGVGGAAMAERGTYWVATHTRIDFFDSAEMMQTATVRTWPAACKPNAIRIYRNYSMSSGGRKIAEGKTEWVVLDRENSIVPFSASGFPQDFEFCEDTVCEGKLLRLRDSFDDEDEVYTFTVRASAIDTGHHMNNVIYVRAMLDCFTARELADMKPASMEIRYAVACMEGELLKIYRKRTDTGYLLGVRKADGTSAAVASIKLAE